jgi:DnaK suppressor protein
MDTPAGLTVAQQRELRAAVVDRLGRVEQQIAALRRSFGEIVESTTLANIDDEHDPEGSTIAWERSQVSALLQEAQAEQRALRVAREQLGEPGYGACEVCGRAIGVERLLALPSARQCVDCAR